MNINIKKLFAMKSPCKDCPFLKSTPLELTEGRLDSIKSDITENDLTPFFCHKTTFRTGGSNDEETGRYHASGQESYCMGAMAYLYAKKRINVPMRLGLTMGLCNIKDIEKSVQFIEVD